MNIIKVTRIKGDLFFTGVDKKGEVKVGYLSKTDIKEKKRIDWGFNLQLV